MKPSKAIIRPRVTPNHSAMRRADSVSPRRGTAFTIIELVIVSSIIAVVSSMAILGYSRALAAYRVDMAARQFSADVTFMRSMARTTSQPRSMSFFLKGNQYTIMRSNGVGSWIGDQPSVSISDAPYKCKLVSVTYVGGSSLASDGFGNLKGGAVIKISSGQQTRTLTVNSPSGSVDVTSP